MRYRYEINDKNEIRIWDLENPNENGAPFFFQPDQPSGERWLNYEQAQAWVKSFISSLTGTDTSANGDEPL
jgi:hypothetical protein